MTTWDQIDTQQATRRQRHALYRLLGEPDIRRALVQTLDRETADHLISLCASMFVEEERECDDPETK